VRAHALFDDYTATIEGSDCYYAGLPGYPRNFSRDTMVTGLLAADPRLLLNQLHVSRIHQGKYYNPMNGEEPGKIHHEYPGVVFRPPYVTTYNACETTALYLLCIEALLNEDRPAAEQFISNHHDSIESAVEYIESHITEDIFWEYPPAPAERFSLRITYWKDSVLPNADRGLEPVYPVAYGLVQFQTARGLLAASRLLHRRDLAAQADRMFVIGIQKFMRAEAFCVAEDRSGPIEQASSDEMHALAYIPHEYGSVLPLGAISRRAAQLVTPVGFASTPRRYSNELSDRYHGYVVWVFEQAMIHYGCQKFGMSHAANVARRSADYIAGGQELLAVEPTIQPLGNDQQLWSVGARVYFSEDPSLRQAKWL
jgi:glycogen debranching enzyme